MPESFTVTLQLTDTALDDHIVLIEDYNEGKVKIIDNDGKLVIYIQSTKVLIVSVHLLILYTCTLCLCSLLSLQRLLLAWNIEDTSYSVGITRWKCVYMSVSPHLISAPAPSHSPSMLSSA